MPLLLLSLTGCGAFADAANSDGGIPDAGPTLKIQPQIIKPGQLGEFTLTFTEGPPWEKVDCSHTYTSKVDTGSTDIKYNNVNYYGEDLITVNLEALSNAKIGERHLRAEVTCARQDQPQLIHSEWGIYFVLDPDQTDGGSK